MSQPAKVYLVDDHPIVRQGLTMLISHEEDLTVCGESDSQFMANQEIEKLKPDLVVVDLALRVGDGIELIKALRASDQHLPILVLTMHEDAFYAERAMRAGARGYLTKGDASKQVIPAIRQLLSGDIYVCNRVAPKLMKRLVAGPQKDDDPVSQLSDRELQVFRLIGNGEGTQQIADDIGLSVKTIETYRANIKRKLDLEDARRLVEYAIRWTVSSAEN